MTLAHANELLQLVEDLQFLQLVLRDGLQKSRLPDEGRLDALDVAKLVVLVAELIDHLVLRAGRALVQKMRGNYTRSVAITASKLKRRGVVAVTPRGGTHELEKLAAKSLASVHADIQAEVRRRLTMARAMELPVNRQMVEGAIKSQWWRVERLARTESSFAVNKAQIDLIQATSAKYPALHKRWTEMIDDTTGRPFDAKVAPDSVVLHGQVVLPNELFIMPPDERAPSKMVGKSWAGPPNRPNDRAVVLPWMKEWGIPGWKWNGRRIPA